MEDVKRLGFPILIITLSAFLTKLIQTYIVGEFVQTLLTIVTVGFLFLFGISLNKGRKKKSTAVFRKVIAILVLVVLLMMQLGYFQFPYISKWFTYLGMGSFYIHMLYIFCGYVFVD